MANIVNDRDKALQATVPRITATSVTISSVAGASFTKLKNTNTVSPANLTLSVNTTGFTSATRTWYYANSTAIGTFNTVSEATVLGLTNANFITHLSTGTFVRYKCVASQTGWTTVETYFDISYSEQANDSPILNITKEALILPTTGLDVCTYTDAYTDISVTIGGTAVTYAASGNNSFSVAIGTIVGTATVTPSTVTNSRRLTISGMNGTGLTATAAIPITIDVIDSRGVTTSFSKTLNVSKVTSGVVGANAITVQLTNDSCTVPTDSDGNNGNYSATPTDIYVFNGINKLNFATSGTAAGTFTIGIPSVLNITSNGTITGNGTDHASVPAASSITQDTATITFPISAYLTAGVATPLTITQSLSRVKSGVAGTPATAYWVSGSSPTLNKLGTLFTPTTVTFSAFSNTSNITSAYSGWFKVYENGNGAASYTSSTASTSVEYTPTSAMTSIICDLYADSGFSNKLDSEGLTVVVNGTTGNSTYTLTVYYQGGTTPTAPTTGTGSYNFSTGAKVMPTGGGVTWVPSQPASSTVATYSTSTTISGQGTSAIAGGTWSAPVLEAINGSTGSNGTSQVRVELYSNTTSTKPSNSAVTYTISTDTFGGTYTNWSPSMPTTTTAATYMTTALVSTTTPTSAVTIATWTTPVIVAQKGADSTVAGPTGNSARIAYIVTTSASPPATPTAVAGDNPPTGWSFTPTATLTAGQFMYQSNGILSTNIAWTTPYLSNLKVGSLSALVANLGTVTLDTTGKLYSGTKSTYASTETGIFLGYDSATTAGYKFKIGTSTTNLGWDGSSLSITGGVFKTATSGARVSINEIANKFICHKPDGTYGFTVDTSTGTAQINSYLNNDGLVSTNLGSGAAIKASGNSTGYALVASGNATKAPISIGSLTTSPSSALDGDIYCNNSTTLANRGLYAYVSGSWVNISKATTTKSGNNNVFFEWSAPNLQIYIDTTLIATFNSSTKVWT